MKYEWDALNRLTAAIPQAPDSSSKKVTFQYDYMNRRVEKSVYAWDDPNGVWETTASKVRRWVYAGWRPVLELDGSGNVVRKYTWGLNLFGQRGGQPFDLSGAGGIGGLLAVYDAGQTDDYVYFHDANGNVGQVVDLSVGDPNNAAVAKYEYDPYGGVTLDLDDPNEVGAYGAENPMRFSTKYFDDETGLGYWGERYYWPKLGRWISRDPIGITGGLNLYGYVMNSPAMWTDPFGLDMIDWIERPSLLALPSAPTQMPPGRPTTKPTTRPAEPFIGPPAPEPEPEPPSGETELYPLPGAGPGCQHLAWDIGCYGGLGSPDCGEAECERMKEAVERELPPGMDHGIVVECNFISPTCETCIRGRVCTGTCDDPSAACTLHGEGRSSCSCISSVVMARVKAR